MTELQSKDYLSNNVAKGMQKTSFALSHEPEKRLLYAQILSSPPLHMKQSSACSLIRIHGWVFAY